MKRLAVSLVLSLVPVASLGEEIVTPVLEPEQLENFQFSNREQESEAIVEELSRGQVFLLNSQRQEIKDLIGQKLGVMVVRGDTSDLRTLQALYDRRVLKDDQAKEWQAAGILFGDILVRKYGLKWVSYEDDLGTSKALQWRNSTNFVFPVTVFSRRLQFGDKLDVRAVFDKVSSEIEQFIADEQRLGRGS
jgi:hypothetical protein